MSDERASGRGWWKWALAAVGAVVAAAIAWGTAEPVSEEVLAEDDARLAGEERARAAALAGSAVAPPAARHADRTPPPWVRPTVLWTIGVVVAVLAAVKILDQLSGVVTWLVLALFFSFALEPAVNYAQSRWGWRRGVTTILLLAFVFVLLVVLGLVFVSAVVQGVIEIAKRMPEWIDQIESWASSTFGISLDLGQVSDSSTATAQSLTGTGGDVVKALFGATFSLIGGLFAFFTVGMFVFYMVAQAGRFKRAVLGFFEHDRQEELVSIWEAAIDKTGGYFYSRLLVAAVNGSLTWIVFRIMGVPGAAALALFQGVVAAFIPIVGTYVASVVPAIVIFMSLGTTETVIYLLWVLVYQQVENLILYPRVQAKTMQLHPAVAFGAALAGGALGGVLWAFLALPFAATIQASASLWIERHEVEETEFVADVAAAPPPPDEGEFEATRVRRFLDRSRGFLRRRPSGAPSGVEPNLGEGFDAVTDAAADGEFPPAADRPAAD